MAYDHVRLKIQNSIKGNASGEITGFLLQDVLLYMVDMLGADIISITAGSIGKATDSDKLGGYPASHYATATSVISLEDRLASMWALDKDGNLTTDRAIIVRNNLIVEGDQSSGGEGSPIIGVTGILIDGVPYRDTNSDGFIDLTDAFKNLQTSITFDTAMSDISENAVQNKVIKEYVDNRSLYEVIGEVEPPQGGGILWVLDPDGNLTTDRAVIIKSNLIVEGDQSSGGEGENTPPVLDLTQLQAYLEEHKYITLDDLSEFLPPDVDLSDYVTKEDVRIYIAELVNGAPTTLDTLGELARAFEESQDVVAILENAIGSKANQAALDQLKASVITLQNTLKTMNEWFTSISPLIVVDEGNIRIKTNTIIEGDIASS